MSDKTNKNLKEAGLKATLPRIKILEILQRTSGTEDHFTAEEIYKELVLNNYDVGLATVYRVLTNEQEVNPFPALVGQASNANLEDNSDICCVQIFQKSKELSETSKWHSEAFLQLDSDTDPITISKQSETFVPTLLIMRCQTCLNDITTQCQR